ncbi:MAG: hypothetical protein MPJ24_08890 [Pirellulaceae bacterium]|nr:hypothetical protein [Pirellulaceae bacterium]
MFEIEIILTEKLTLDDIPVTIDFDSFIRLAASFDYNHPMKLKPVII